VTLYTHCPEGASLLCGHLRLLPVPTPASPGAMLGTPLVATTSEGRQLLVGVMSSSSDALRDETAGGVLDTPSSLRFVDVETARAWILAASGPPSLSLSSLSLFSLSLSRVLSLSLALSLSHTLTHSLSLSLRLPSANDG